MKKDEYPGKRKCEVLKDIRRKIAESEGIKYAPAECHHEGDCLGTCPRCEAEVQYLEREIARKHGRAFRPAAAAAVVGSLLVAASSCTSCQPPVQGELEPTCGADGETYYVDAKMGEVPHHHIVDSARVGDRVTIVTATEITDDGNLIDEKYDITLTEDMIGEDLYMIDSTTHIWRAVEEEKAKKNKAK